MVSNPMQRKSRNAFLLGIIVTLIIAGAIIALLLVQLKQRDDKIKAEQAAKVKVYTLSTNVKAGQVITQDMFTEQEVNRYTIPNNALETPSDISTWGLQTKEGEYVYTDRYGLLYLYRDSEDKPADNIIEVIKNTGDTIEDSKGNKIANGELYVDVEGTIEKVTSNSSNMQTDEAGQFFVDTQGKDKITRVYQEELTYQFYVYKIDTSTVNTSGSQTRIKEYIDIQEVPMIARVNMNANTIVTPELVVRSSENITDDTREEEYNMLVLPIDLMTGDYVDIRFMTPTGQNFIVVSKAKVEVPMNNDGTYVSDTIKVNLREDEILSMSSAIVEAYGLNGSKLYVTKYTDPAMQEAATPTYVPNAAVTSQIQSNPNIVEVAKEELKARYSEASKKVRNDYLQQYINGVDSNEYNTNIQEGMNEDIGTSLTTRKKYLDSLNY